MWDADIKCTLQRIGVLEAMRQSFKAPTRLLRSARTQAKAETLDSEQESMRLEEVVVQHLSSLLSAAEADCFQMHHSDTGRNCNFAAHRAVARHGLTALACGLM